MIGSTVWHRASTALSTKEMWDKTGEERCARFFGHLYLYLYVQIVVLRRSIGFHSKWTRLEIQSRRVLNLLLTTAYVISGITALVRLIRFNAILITPLVSFFLIHFISPRIPVWDPNAEQTPKQLVAMSEITANAVWIVFRIWRIRYEPVWPTYFREDEAPNQVPCLAGSAFRRIVWSCGRPTETKRIWSRIVTGLHSSVWVEEWSSQGTLVREPVSQLLVTLGGIKLPCF